MAATLDDILQVGKNILAHLTGEEREKRWRERRELPFVKETIDLTAAHTNLERKVPPCNFIQAICDGLPAGITIKLFRPDEVPIPLDQIDVIPTYGADYIYITNDVRAGRSSLHLYFLRTPVPFHKLFAGDPVSHAELAARLGSIHHFDRRGDVLFLEDFEQGVRRWDASGDTGYAVTASSSYARSGILSAKLVTGAVLNNSVTIVRDLPTPFPTAKHGIEAHFNIGTVATVKLMLQLIYYSGARQYYAAIAYDRNNTRLEYFNTAGGWTIFATGVTLGGVANLFLAFKMVTDLSAAKYVRAVVNSVSYDLSAYSIYQTLSAANQRLYAGLSFQTLSAASRTAYVDDIIITQNEP